MKNEKKIKITHIETFLLLTSKYNSILQNSGMKEINFVGFKLNYTKNYFLY